jgi:hypothetical protein
MAERHGRYEADSCPENILFVDDEEVLVLMGKEILRNSAKR